METMYLVGFMGAGKTSISQELAKRLSVPVYDTDKEIVKSSGKSINEIFATDGEAKFREIESEVLQKMPSEEAIVATGGGIVGAERNRLFLREKANVVFLYTELSEIIKRVEGDDSRPLLQKGNLDAAETLYRSRLPLYRETANIEIDTSGKSIPAIVDEIVERMKN
ncbi:shikimate kinase [Mesobacillus subterraneus]|uniref:shikimate kinase n=1 Tax=Mesobacillus subterraneus TaxID=285983 RepID=UPI00203EA996|nr:shikimate kinase [Mesobacillus subterraneus]MCM3665481.1 shikimate kinase [Mesobacillus subterraneus]MCM3684512.1 shikimate kinase [Mesobacillus subterraneus]